MYVLGLDTSTKLGGVALLQAGELVGEYALNIRTTHSERLLPALQQLLADGGISLDLIGGVAVVIGPGSFTGLRIGVATAKGFAYALGQPLLGVTTLEAYGWQFQFFPGVVIALIDARRQLVYAQSFARGEALTKPGNRPLQEVLAWCRDQEPPFLFVGDGAITYAEQIKEELAEAFFAPAALGLLRPSAVAGLGYKRLLQGQTSNAFSLNPIYMRQTEAERKWQERN